jgi:hypothetical protein
VEDALSRYETGKLVRYPPPQSRLMELERDDLPAHGVRLNTPASCFDLR